ncbi:MAG: glycosyltransferase family 39 protein, partial [Bacteroidota bacterium]
MNIAATVNEKPDSWQRWAIVLIIMVASLMRLPWLAEISLSNDELSALIRARHVSFNELIVKGVHIDYHPAGVEVFIHYWVKIFGEGAFMLRLPFALLSIGSVYLVFLLGRRWFNVNTGLMVAAFFATFEHPLLYSILARMYSPGLFFCLLAAFHWSGWINAVRSGREVSSWDVAGLSVAMLFAPHTHYFVVVQLFVMGMSGFIMLPASEWLRYASVCVIGALSFFTEWTVFKVQMSTGDLGGWLGKPGSDFLINYFKEVFNGFILLPIFLLIVSAIGSLSALNNGHSRQYFFCGTGWFL